MVDRLEPNRLYAEAFSAAEDAFTVAGGAPNPHTVCAVAIHTQSDTVLTLFSGKPGYDTLAVRRSNATGAALAAVKTAITGELRAFLQTPAGGQFNLEQINNAAFAAHGRGAMNCAEPKIYNYVLEVRGDQPGNWVLIPFHQPGGVLAYIPPCENCRRWVYRHFNRRSFDIAQARSGAGGVAGWNAVSDQLPPL